MQALENDLRDRLVKGGFLKQPQIGVSVDQYRSQQIFVMGEVRQPGSLQFTGSMSIIEALARVGSTTERAGPEAVILRSSNGGSPPDAAAIERAQNSAADENSKDPNVIRINLQNLQGTLSQNVELRAGDTIFVPRAESVFVSGQVRTVGRVCLPQGHDRAAGADACRRRHRTWVHPSHPDYQEHQRSRYHDWSNPSGPGSCRGHHCRPRRLLLIRPSRRFGCLPEHHGVGAVRIHVRRFLWSEGASLRPDAQSSLSGADESAPRGSQQSRIRALPIEPGSRCCSARRAPGKPRSFAPPSKGSRR